jgi:cytochrome c556
MHRRVTFLMSTLVVVALATAACSGGGQLSHDEYQQKLTQIASDFKTKEQSALGALGGIQSPNDPADANAKLVSGFHGIADAFREFAKAAEAKDLAKLQSLGQSFQNSPAAKELSTASSELKKAGYKVPNST